MNIPFPLRVVPLAALSLLAWGCGGPPPFVLNPKYEKADFKGRTLAVFPIQDLDVENMDDFRDDLIPKEPTGSTEPDAVIGRLFFRELDGLADHARVIHDSTLEIGAKDFRDTTLMLPGKSGGYEATFRFPDGKALADSGREADLGLQLQRVRTSRTSTHTPGHWAPGPSISVPGGGSVAGAGMMVGGGGHQSLELYGSYILWDYKAGEPVAYGRFQAKSNFQFFMDESDWKAVASSAAQAIVKRSPLKGSKLVRRNSPSSSYHGAVP